MPSVFHIACVFFIFSSTGRRPASNCHGVVSGVRASVSLSVSPSVRLSVLTKSVTKKEMNKCMAEIYDPGGIRTRAALLISQYHNH